MSFDLPQLCPPYSGFDTVIDVRSPSEYREDHIPGAINLPVLSDEERARVGTVYVQQSPFLARKIGAALVARNAAAHIEGPLAEFDGGWRPLVYCWRGGQRSGSFASILSQIGWRADTVTGGYQSYRRLVVRTVYETKIPSPLFLLDGNTGTAKTELLGVLKQRCVQVIDLEGLARHRGSALGGRGVQPSQKAFEGSVAAAVAGFDPSKPMVVEAESSKVGRLNVPPRLLEAMRTAPRLLVSAPVEERARYLMKAYADVIDDPAILKERLALLTRLQGRERVARWTSLVNEGAYEDLAIELIEQHYDPRYKKTRDARGAVADKVFETSSLAPDGLEVLADRLVEAINLQ